MYNAFLKWAGGKRQSLEMIEQVLHVDIFSPLNIKKFIEPFVGSGIVSLNIKSDYYILGDINTDLINLYNTLKVFGEDFINYCENFFVDSNNEDTYYRYRDLFNSVGDIYTKSAIFIYLNRHSFNGLCRYNSKGLFNVPFGKYKSVYFPRKELIRFYNKAQSCLFVNCDFEETLQVVDKDSVVYCDPPYSQINKNSFVNYSGVGFNEEDHKRLVKFAEASDCMFLISNSCTEYTKGLYKNADEIIEADISRHISANSGSRKKAKELLAIYY